MTQIKSKALLIAFVFSSVHSAKASDSTINEKACAIWLCLPQGFLPPSCFPALLEFEKRKAMPFTPAIPPLPQCLRTLETVLGSKENQTYLANLAYSEAREMLSKTEDGQKRTETYRDCTMVTLAGQAFGSPYCSTKTVETNMTEDQPAGNGHE